MILCGKEGDTSPYLAPAEPSAAPPEPREESHLHEAQLFHPLHDDGQNNWREGRDELTEEENAAKDVQDLLIPGAAMATRETTTCAMPFAAAFCRDRGQRSGVRGQACAEGPGLGAR